MALIVSNSSNISSSDSININNINSNSDKNAPLLADDCLLAVGSSNVVESHAQDVHL